MHERILADGDSEIIQQALLRDCLDERELERWNK